MPFIIAPIQARPRAAFTTRGVLSVCRYAIDRRRHLAHLAVVLCRAAGGLIRLYFAVRWSVDKGPMIAVALLGNMGDIMAGEPIAGWRAALTWRKILWMTEKRFAPLVTAFPDVDAVFTVSCLTEWVLLWRCPG